MYSELNQRKLKTGAFLSVSSVLSCLTASPEINVVEHITVKEVNVHQIVIFRMLCGCGDTTRYI